MSESWPSHRRPSHRALTAKRHRQARLLPRTSTAADDGWHFVVAPYLWLTGMHGTVGTPAREISVHASAADLLSHFRFGLMGLVEADHKRLVLPLDIVWARLGDSQALPFPNIAATTAEVKVDESMLTPKIGYRLLDQQKLKIDALTGFRYWHLGQNLQFSPSRPGLNFSGSQNWVDLLGWRTNLGSSHPQSERIHRWRCGGWGAGSQLDYQVFDILWIQDQSIMGTGSGLVLLGCGLSRFNCLRRSHVRSANKSEVRIGDFIPESESILGFSSLAAKT